MEHILFVARLEKWLGQCVALIENFFEVLSLEKLQLSMKQEICVDFGILSDVTLMAGVP